MIVRMRTGGSSVWMRSLVELFRTYGAKTTRDMNSFQPFSPTIYPFRRDDSQSCQGLKLISSVKAGKNINHGPKIPKLQPSSPKSGFNFPTWTIWLLGSVMSILYPFGIKKMKKLKQIEGEVEMAMEGAEAAAEMVEKVATATEKMTKKLEETLPENSKLKKAALVVDHIAEVAAHEAHLTQEFLHKIDDLKQDMEDLEAIIEPVVDKFAGDDETKQLKDEANPNCHLKRN